jgi:hypothetical protein
MNKSLGTSSGATSGTTQQAGVSKDVLRNLQDVVWSDDEVSSVYEFRVARGIELSSRLRPGVYGKRSRYFGLCG